MTSTIPHISATTAGNDPGSVAGVDPRTIGTQQTFRVALAAMTTPGRILQLTWDPELSHDLAGPDRWLAALLLALADHEVSVAFDLGGRSGVFAGEIGRWTRAGVADAEAADMVVVDAATMAPGLPARLRRGSLQYPDDSALLIIQVERLAASGGEGVALDLSGPGVDGRIGFLVTGLSDGVIASRDLAVSQYPTGIDLLLVDREGRITGIPRTSAVTVGPVPGGER